MRTSAVLAANFTRWGITHVFGIPGKSISPLLLDVDSQGIRFVLSRHESGAGFEAAGYAMLKKSLGIAIVTSGPGGTNALTSAAQAKAFHAPVLFITGQPSAVDTGRALGQDSSQFGTDLVKMFEPVTIFSARVERADMLPLYLQHALEKAFTGTKGPVHLCIPFDVLVTDSEPFSLPLPRHIPHMMSPDVENMIPLLDQAQRPVLILGKGVGASEAYEEVAVLAEHWGIPVITTPGGKGAFPSYHPLSLGNFGLGGTTQAAEYLSSGVDLMIVIGTKLSDMSLSGLAECHYPQQVIHFDYDATFMGKTIPVPTHIMLGDAKLNLQRLLSHAHAARKDYPMRSLDDGEWAYEPITAQGLSARIAVQALRRALPHDAILFGDDGSHTFYAIRYYGVYQAGTFYFDDVFGAMGHPIGYVIGAKLACPERHIVCLTGDGCIGMHGQEIATAVNERVPVIFVVFNNGQLDMVDKGMSYNTGRTVGAVYETPLHVAQFALSLGANAYRCHNVNEIAAAMERALDSRMPTVVEVMVDPTEIPPILTRLLSLD